VEATAVGAALPGTAHPPSSGMALCLRVRPKRISAPRRTDKKKRIIRVLQIKQKIKLIRLFKHSGLLQLYILLLL